MDLCKICLGTKPSCLGCPRAVGTEQLPYHYVLNAAKHSADLVIIAEAPAISRNANTDQMHTAFSDDAGKILNSAVWAIQKKYPHLRIHKTYAVLCTGVDPDKETVTHCRPHLLDTLRSARQGFKNPALLVMGMTAVRALGIKAPSLKAVQGRILADQIIDTQPYNVVITISTKQLVAMAGVYDTFLNDLDHAAAIAEKGLAPTDSLEVLTKDYVKPRTVEEVKAICDLIIRYAENGCTPEAWSIATDTETNTLFPHRDSLKVLCVSFAWATGRATAIPLWHPETPYDPQLVVPYVQAVLACLKPKCFHNAKYDLKVFRKLDWSVQNIAWDTMLGEHVLEEDKKGQYGLKELTRRFFPEFAAYADTLHEMLEQQEGDSQLANIRKIRKTEGAPKALTKKQKKLLDGGFEKIPLELLLLYASVDADMTRRLSMVQLARIRKEEHGSKEKKKRLAEVVAGLAALAKRDKIQDGERPAIFPVPNLCTASSPLMSLLSRTGLPITHVLSKMEYGGVRIDRPYLSHLQASLETVIQGAEQKLFAIAQNPDLKLNHALAISNLLFRDGFMHPVTNVHTVYPKVTINGKDMVTAKGQLQTTDKVLQHLVARYECPFSTQKLIYAKAYKAKNTFCANVWDLSTLDGYLHTNYNIHGCCTGRLSSSDTNMQNIPKKLAGYSVKKIFLPDDDSSVFVNADAKSAEIRIFTAYSHDQELIRSLNDGLDTHSFTASKIVAVVRESPGAAEVLQTLALDDARPLTYEDFANRKAIKLTDPDYFSMLDKFRDRVKRVVFGILYGAGYKKIGETAGISSEQAQSIMSLLFKLFPSIPLYMEQTKWELENLDYVETYFGRRRRFSVKGAPRYLRGRAERQAINFKIQSTSSDIVEGRLIDIEGPLTRDLHGRLLLTVHDSIGFGFPKKYLSQLPDFLDTYLVKRAAAAHPWLPVAFEWEFEVGPSYGELKPYNEYMQNLTTIQESSDVKEAYTEEEIRTVLADPLDIV